MKLAIGIIKQNIELGRGNKLNMISVFGIIFWLVLMVLFFPRYMVQVNKGYIQMHLALLDMLWCVEGSVLKKKGITVCKIRIQQSQNCTQ